MSRGVVAVAGQPAGSLRRGASGTGSRPGRPGWSAHGVGGARIGPAGRRTTIRPIARRAGSRRRLPAGRSITIARAPVVGRPGRPDELSPGCRRRRHVHGPRPGRPGRAGAHAQGPVGDRRLRRRRSSPGARELLAAAGIARGRRSARSCTARPSRRTRSSSAAARGPGCSRPRGSATCSRSAGCGWPGSTTSTSSARRRSSRGAGGARSASGSDHRGEVRTPLDPASVVAALDRLLAEGVRVDRHRLPPRLRRLAPTSRPWRRSSASGRPASR